MIQPLDPVSVEEQDNDERRLIERIRNRLAVVIPDARGIEIKVRGGVVTLSGIVRDSAQRRIATIATHQVAGVTNVVNKLTDGNGIRFPRYGALLAPAPRRGKTPRRAPAGGILPEPAA